MVRSALSRHLGQRHGCDDWTNHDAWFRTRMLDLFVGLDASDAEKMSRFILSLLLAAPGEIDYARERELFKYNKLSPNSRTHEHTNLDYVDGKRPLRVAIEELSVLTDDAACSATLIHELVQLIECGRRKRKVSETQSVGSSRSSSSSSSYEEEFPSLGHRRAAAAAIAPKSAPPWQPHENLHWSSAPHLIPIEKAPYPSAKSPKPPKTAQSQQQTGQSGNSSKYRFAFKNPKNKKTTSPQSKTPSPTPQRATTPTPIPPTPPSPKPKKTKTTKSDRPPDLVVKNGKTTIAEEETKTTIKTTTTTTTTPGVENTTDKHCKKRERNRKRKRPRKKKTPQKTDKNSSDSISPVPSSTTTSEPLPRAQNLDSFTSLDDALVFLQNQSGAVERDDCDGEIWRKVMADQHVKYVNGSFFFSPRIRMPIRKPKPRNESDPLLANAAKIAYRTVSTIFDAMDDTSADETSAEPRNTKMQLSISDDKWPVKKPTNGMPVWTSTLTGSTW